MPSKPEIYLDTPAFYADSRKAWRKWLLKNGEIDKKVWLIMYRKNTGVPSLTYAEAVEEALCFGWIDSKANKRDDQSFYQYFCRRKPASNWSALNKSRVERLTKEGLMMPAGQAMIDLARESGTWDALNKVSSLELPDDLKAMFAKNKTAEKNFTGFPASAKKGILDWIQQAKLPATRLKRIKETVSLAAINKRANQYTPK